jgi:hypothetical protein
MISLRNIPADVCQSSAGIFDGDRRLGECVTSARLAGNQFDDARFSATAEAFRAQVGTIKS